MKWRGLNVCTPVVPILRKLRQKDFQFKASLGYLMRSIHKTKPTLENDFNFHQADTRTEAVGELTEKQL